MIKIGLWGCCKRFQNEVYLNIKTKKVEKVMTTLKGRIGHPLKSYNPLINPIQAKLFLPFEGPRGGGGGL